MRAWLLSLEAKVIPAIAAPPRYSSYSSCLETGGYGNFPDLHGALTANKLAW